jgi:hypothetical protein
LLHSFDRPIGKLGGGGGETKTREEEEHCCCCGVGPLGERERERERDREREKHDSNPRFKIRERIYKHPAKIKGEEEGTEGSESNTMCEESEKGPTPCLLI